MTSHFFVITYKIALMQADLAKGKPGTIEKSSNERVSRARFDFRWRKMTKALE